MTEFWNPDTHRGENPFTQFSTWAEFITHYAVPKNVISREKGPGDAVGHGEWYLTHCIPDTGDEIWYLSYVSETIRQYQSRGGPIKYMALRSNVIPDSAVRGVWAGGHKDAWSKTCKLHYKVNIEDVIGVHFINWTYDPFKEVKE